MEEYIAAAFISTERGKKTVKQPVGRPRKRPLESDCQAQADKENVFVDMVAPHHAQKLHSSLVPAIIVYRNRVELHTSGLTVNFRSNLMH